MACASKVLNMTDAAEVGYMQGMTTQRVSLDDVPLIKMKQLIMNELVIT